MPSRRVIRRASDKPVPKSPRQYALNSPALRITRELSGIKPEPWPGFVKPALASPIDAPRAGDQWLHEIKFHGYRLQIHLRQGQAQLLHEVTTRGKARP